MKVVLATLSFVLFLMWGVFRTIMGIDFSVNIEDYVSQAASSPSPQIAAEKLTLAINAAQIRGLTKGNTGIFFSYPTNDVEFWYNRLVDSRAILSHLSPNDSPLEISNTMMRVHEILSSSNDKGGQEIVSPDGISIYPDNVLFFWWGLMSLSFGCLFLVLVLMEL